MKFNDTLENSEWLAKNKNNLKAILPETWTHISNLNGLQMAYSFKLLGLDWRSDNEFGQIMVKLEKIGIIQRDNILIRRSNI